MGAIGADYRVLNQGFAISTQNCERATPEHDIIHAFASYFGGLGEQDVTWWKNGVKYSICSNEERCAAPSPISRALAALGANREDSDEFDAVGLGIERDNDWI